MQFGNPIFLWGLLAVPLPILLHLFFRRRKSRVPFSTLQFFQHRKRYLAHRRRLRELLLLLIRTLALLFLVLALARMLFQRMPYAFAARSDVVIVLDDTLSMNRKLGSGETAFTLASRKAQEILDTLSEGDATALIFLSGRSGIDLTRKRSLVQELIENARVTAATGSYSAALKQAEGILGTEANPNREIFIISDFQRNQAPSKAIALENVKGVRIYFLPITASEENLSVDGVSLSKRPQMVNKRMVIPYTIHNHGDNNRETEVTLSIDGETLNSENLSIPAGESVAGSFENIPGDAGFISGSLRITDRNLSLDNSCYFTVNVSANIRVLLLESDILSRVRPFHFLKLALDPAAGKSLNGIQTEEGFVQELSQNQLDQYHVVVLSNPIPLNTQTATLLFHYISRGGSVLVFAGGKTDITTFAAFQDERLRSIFGKRQAGYFSGLTFKGPLNVLNDLLQMDLFKGKRFYTLNPSPAAVILAESRGLAVLASEKIGSGNFIACALSSRRDMSNWPELKSYPIAMIHLLSFAAHDPQQNTGVDCGQLLRLTAKNEKENTLPISHSNGKTYSIPIKEGTSIFSNTWQPGIVTAERAVPRSSALNPVSTESNLKALSPLRLTSIVKGKVNLLKTDAALASQLRNTRRGSDMTGLFLFLLMIMLLLEIVLGNPYIFARRSRTKT